MVGRRRVENLGKIRAGRRLGNSIAQKSQQGPIFHTLNTGESTQQFLIETAVRLDCEALGKRRTRIKPYQSFLQLFWNIAGLLMGALTLRWSGASLANCTTRWIASSRTGTLKVSDTPQSCENIARARELTDRIIHETRVKPALLILISHPETVGEESGFLGHLLCRAIDAIQTILPGSRLKLVQAIDPFALDSLHWITEGTYAGFIAAGHLAVDRQPYLRASLQRHLLANAHYSRAIFSILHALKKGDVVCAALGGGVPHNARIFYTIREFARRVYREEFPSRMTRRDFESEIIQILARDRHSASVTGLMQSSEQQEIAGLLKKCGISEHKIKGLLENLGEELSRRTPYRQRFFHVLFRRLCFRGKPLLILPMAHRTGPAEINAACPVLVTAYKLKERSVVHVNKDLHRETVTDEPAFVQKIVKESF